MTDKLYLNIKQLLTNGPLVKTKKTTFIKDEDLGIIEGAWLHVNGGKVVNYGQGTPDDGTTTKASETIDLSGMLVMPGLVDSHTHPVFGGNRSNEFFMRLNGKSYEEIAAAGGGIKASMKFTQEASDQELENITRKHLLNFLSHGVTTVEAKSGYGLSVKEEIRHLEILKSCKDKVPMTLKTTCLALHAIPSEYKDETDYIEQVARPVISQVIAEGLADYVDAFIENGYFSVDGTKEIFSLVSNSPLKIRLHADEFSDAGAANFSAEINAKSADHLQFASDKGIKEMAKNGVTATILPGTSVYTNIPFTNGRRFADAGCPVAIATDFNPGSCVIDNLPMLATIAGLHCGLRPAEILAGITYVPAASLDLESSKGALVENFDADFIVHPAGTVADWLADIGRTKPGSVYISGEKVI